MQQLYEVAQKNVTMNKMQFLDKRWRSFFTKFHDLQQNEFSTVLENFTEIF